MNDQQIEQEIQTKGKTAPRITPVDVQEVVIAEFFFTAREGIIGATGRHPPSIILNQSTARLTFCVLVLRNGFTVTGESACASPENFDAEIGRKVARQNAEQKIWPLLGYALKESLRKEASDV